MGLTYSPLVWGLYVGQEVDDRVASLCLRVKEQALTVVFACVLNGSLEYSDFLVSLAGAPGGAPAGDSFILLEDFNTHLGSDSETWTCGIRRNGLSELNLRNVLLFEFCSSHNLSTTNTTFKHKCAHKCTWNQ